jgi:hypothetical protein
LKAVVFAGPRSVEAFDRRADGVIKAVLNP